MGREWAFQTKLDDCVWMGVCRLQMGRFCRLRVKCFLRVVVLDSVNTTRDHGREHG